MGETHVTLADSGREAYMQEETYGQDSTGYHGWSALECANEQNHN